MAERDICPQKEVKCGRTRITLLAVDILTFLNYCRMRYAIQKEVRNAGRILTCRAVDLKNITWRRLTHAV